MRFYSNQHRYYCGIDLHSKTMYVCIVDKEGKKLFHKNMECNREEFLTVIEKYREDLVVGVECTFSWYWIADLCAEEGIAFTLGHALYMNAVHGAKSKNDKVDSERLALLLKSGMFPTAYVYPKEMRGTRDLMRRRLYFVHKRAELMAHIQMTYQQYNMEAPPQKLLYKKNRDALVFPFEDSVNTFLEADREMITHISSVIRKLEAKISSRGIHSPANTVNLSLLQSIPGIGDILSATILYEMHDVSRFPSVHHFASYARLVKPEKSSGGKRIKAGKKKIGNPHLKWAFSEAALLFIRSSDEGKKLHLRLKKKYPKGKALSILAHKLGRTAYHLLLKQQAFDRRLMS